LLSGECSSRSGQSENWKGLGMNVSEKSGISVEVMETLEALMPMT